MYDIVHPKRLMRLLEYLMMDIATECGQTAVVEMSEQLSLMRTTLELCLADSTFALYPIVQFFLLFSLRTARFI